MQKIKNKQQTTKRVRMSGNISFAVFFGDSHVVAFGKGIGNDRKF